MLTQLGLNASSVLPSNLSSTLLAGFSISIVKRQLTGTDNNLRQILLNDNSSPKKGSPRLFNMNATFCWGGGGKCGSAALIESGDDRINDNDGK